MSKRIKKEQRAKQAEERRAALDKRLVQLTAVAVAASWLVLAALWYWGTLRQPGAFAVAVGVALALLTVVRVTYGIPPTEYTVILGAWALLLGIFALTGRHTITPAEVILVPAGMWVIQRLFASRRP